MKAELCNILNRIGALEFGVFKLTTGRTRPYYIDLRIVISFPDAFRRICDFYRNSQEETLELAVLRESRKSQPLVYHSRPSSPTNSRSLFFIQGHGNDFTGEREDLRPSLFLVTQYC